MKEKKATIFTKLIMVMLMIISILSSSIMPIISYAVETIENAESEKEDKYVKFDVTWGDGTTEITHDAGTVSAPFTLQFDTLENFKNIKIQVEKTDNVSVSYSIREEYSTGSNSVAQIQYVKDMPGGDRIKGSINFNFYKAEDFKEYQKDLVIKLTGTYELDGEEVSVEITKKLTAKINTPEEVSLHDLYLSGQSQRSIKTSSNTLTLYSVSEINETFKLGYGYYNSEYFKVELEFYRKGNNNKIYYPDEVSCDNLEITKIDNGDGTYKYIAEKGKEHEQYESNNVSSTTSEYYENSNINVKYLVEHPEEDVGTTTMADIKLISKGYNITRNENGTTAEKDTKERLYSTSHFYALYRYTPGAESWGNCDIEPGRDENYYSYDDLERLLKDDVMDILFETNISYIHGGIDKEENTIITQTPVEISYNGKNLSSKNNEIYIKSISVDKIHLVGDSWIKFYEIGATEPFFIATKDRNYYQSTSGDKKINSYYAELSNPLKYDYGGWNTCYEMCASELKKDGLTDNDILNIRRITVSQTSDSGANIYTRKKDAIYHIEEKKTYRTPKRTVSSFSIDETDNIFNCNVSDIGKKVTGNINLILNDESLKDSFYLKSTNPIFYIELPNEFDLEINSITGSFQYSSAIESWRIKKCNGNKILEIKCIGQTTFGDCIKISCNRILKSTTKQFGYLKVYMQTDEGSYYGCETDDNDYNGDGNTLDILCYRALKYSIDSPSKIRIESCIYTASGELKENENVILEKGKTAKCAVKISNNEDSIRDVFIITRLPFIGNKNVNNTIDLGTTCELTNIKNIKVFQECNGVRRELETSTYQVGYSSNEIANFDTDFNTEEQDTSTVKTIQIKMSDGYILYKGYNLFVEYELDVPEDAQEGNIASQISAYKYTDKDGNLQSQESRKSNIVVGNPNGTVKIIKSFEGTNNTENLGNIEFRITNMDDNTKFYTGTTNETGELTFENIPAGEWEITEITQHKNYEAISPQYVKITNGEQYTGEQAIKFENKIKKCKLEIEKKWEDAESSIKEVQFTITGNTIAGDEYSTSTVSTKTTTDEQGNKTSKVIAYVPYGTYTVEEKTHTYGWYSEPKEVELNSTTAQIIMENKITTGTMKIVKTVPEGETVKGLTFKITGIGDISYKNKEGNEVIFDIDKTITIPQDESEQVNEDAQIIISENQRKATIVIPNIPAGTYKVEEINMPTVETESGEVTKYVNVKKEVRIPDKNGDTTAITIENKHKNGNIKIQVIADEGIDLEEFKVKISGTSYYGNCYEEELNVPASGIITLNELEIGKYKVEEVGTKELNGKIYTTIPDGFEVTYNPENANKENEIQYGKTTNVEIHNKYVGKGTVKIVKTLENEEDKSKASGIQFKIVGKDLAGKDVNETITIGGDGTGLSNEIPVGTYLLSEVEETVPEIYEIAEDQEITITTENTQEKPLELQIENKLINSKKIIMETELEEGGVPETPVNYTVTKVDNNLNKLEEPIEVQGDKKSHAELDGLKGGRYIVEQKDIPEGYIKDTRQVLDVTRYGTGYALFILQKEQNITETETTKVIIEKEIQNEEGNIATQEDYEKAKINLKDKYSFEVKLQNLDTKETFYTFMDEKNKDTIEGLPYGTYEIEEIYKPKFKMLEIEGEQIQKNEETGKYTFTLQENQKTINIKIKNQINTDFGFGGQDTKDNLSKVLQEKIEEVVITKARIYVRDDEGNKISEATFKIYDTQGNLIKFAGGNGTFIPSEEGNETIKPYNGNITIKGLSVGNYKLINETIDDKYLKATDKTITIYKDAVGITRIELLRNIPRGNLRLSTTYQTASGEQKYAPRSKYKILNPETEEILTFTKKADGTYQRSSLPNATEDISLRAGYVDVTGIEAGIDYQVGIVDLTEKYGVIKEEPETVGIEDGVQKEVSVSVEERGQRFQKALWVDSSFFIALDIEGKIWSSDRYSNYGKLYNQLTCVNDYSENEIIKNVRFKEINILNPSQIYLIDEEGKIWTMSGDGRNLKCISDIDGSLMKNVKIEKIGISSSNSYALDEKGKVWRFMQISVNADIDVGITPTKDPICISEKGNLKNVVITDIKTNGSSVIALDNTGKVWTWGMNLNYQCGTDNNGEKIEPTCISDLEGSNIHDLKIEKIEMGNGYSYLIDTQHRLWTFGHKNWKSEDTEEKYFWNPICINENNNETELNGIGVINIEIGNNIAHQQFIKVIDEEGKLWAWIDSPNSSTLETEMCISDRGDFELDNVEIVQASIIYNKGIAIDKQGSIWMWGQGGGINLVVNWNNQGPKSGIMVNPTKYNPQKKSYFSINKFVKVYAGYYNSVAIDESGRVWTWGANKADNGYSNNLGIGSEEDFVTTTPVCVGGGNSQISKEKIVDVALNSWITVALDDDGKVWFWGHGRGWIQKVHDPVCISTLNYDWNGLFGKKIKQIKCNLGNNHYKGSYSEKIAAIDTDGKIYMIDLSSISGIDNGAENDKYEYLADIEFVKIQSGAANFMALDSKGKVWVWKINEKGFDEPYCLNEQEETLNEIKIKEMSIGGGPNTMGESNGESKFFIDENNDLWVLGNNSYGELGTVGYVNKIKCITQDATNTLYGKKIIKAVVGGNIGEIGFSDRETNLISLVVDSEGKIWTCGGRNYRNDTNVARFKCINEDIDLDPADISIGNNYCLAVDKSGNIWSWGNNKYAATGKTEDYSDKPQKLIGETYKYNPEYGKKYENVSEYALISENVKYGNDGQMGIKQKKSYRDIVTMEIDCEGNLWSYGLNNKYAILGEGTQDSRQEPKCINYKFNNKIDEIVYLSDTNAVIKDVEGKIWTWGSNGNGQCGTGSTADVLEPTCINADKFTAKDIKFINGTIIVQDTEGKIWTWGSNSNGQCGTGNTANVLEPTCVSEGKFTAKDIKFNSYSGLTMIVQDTEGRIWTWGSNQYGKCGTGSTGNVLEPTWINSGKFIVKEIKVEVSSPIVTVEDTEGRTWTWGGYYNIPICINGDANNSENTDKNVKTYNIFGNTFNIKKDEEGKIWTWGYNEYGQCGTGNTDSVPEPVCISENKFTVNDIEDIQFISYGNSAPVATIIVKDTEGKIWTWGNNSSGQCGIDDQDSTMPVILEPTCISTNKFIAKDIQYIVNGTEATAIVRDTEGKIWMWGSNATGQCGTGDTNNVLEPRCINVDKFIANEIKIVPYCFNGVVKVEGPNGNPYEYTMPRIGATIIVQDQQGKIWTWGYNGNGQCGTGNTNNVLEPTCISEDKFTIKDMRVIQYEYTETIMVETSNGTKYPRDESKIGITIIVQDQQGKIWTWGYNGNGQCGTGNTNNVLEPTCVNEDNKFKAQEILQADDTIIVRDTEGRNWTWGKIKYEEYGRTILSPTSEEFKIEKVIRSDSTAVLQDTEGRIWTCGENQYGQCGTGNKENVSELTCINEENKFKVEKIIRSDNTIILQDTEGKIWAWGENTKGQCGTGNKQEVLTPTCISDIYAMDFKGTTLKVVTTESQGTFILAIDKNKTAWMCKPETTPIKLNNLNKINNKKIEEVAVINTGSTFDITKIAILTTDGILYITDYNLQTVEGIGEQEIIGSYGKGPWKKEFILIKDSKY